MRIWPFLLLSASLLSTVNEPLRTCLLSGYRNDRLHWHLQSGGAGTLTYRELYRDVQFLENGLALQAIHRDLAFWLRGSYGAFGRGNLFQRYADLPFTAENPRFQFSTHGWAADASGYFGYAVNLTTDRTYKVIVIPLVGYSAHFEHLHRREGSPNPLQSEDAVGASSFSMQSSLPGSLHLTWYGFYVGAGFLIEPTERLRCSGGYSYHWLGARLKTQMTEIVSLYDPSLFSEQSTQSSLHTKGSGNLGQTGWAQIEWAPLLLWRIGFGSQIHYFSTSLLETRVKEQQESLVPSPASSERTRTQKLKMRWVPISGWFTVSREF
ncbi:MAG: hypothetical protein HY861_03545 [Chlamydiia bacterium]|nr:hypothetical protein [Chlamydiia bacterium]